jgi:CBS domain-containing protein
MPSIWEQTKCLELLKGQKVIEIPDEASVAFGCETLVKNGISSAPVYSKSSASYVGMFDYRDIVSFVLIAFQKKQLEPVDEFEASSDDPGKQAHIDDMIKKLVVIGDGEEVEARMVSDLSHRNPFYSVREESPLADAVEILGKSGVHRVNVLGNDGRVKGVMSQTDVVLFLDKQVKAICLRFPRKTNSRI